MVIAVPRIARRRPGQVDAPARRLRTRAARACRAGPRRRRAASSPRRRRRQRGGRCGSWSGRWSPCLRRRRCPSRHRARHASARASCRLAISASAAFACASASSAVTTRKALYAGSTSAIRSSSARVHSTGDSFFARSSAAPSAIESQTRSVMVQSVTLPYVSRAHCGTKCRSADPGPLQVRSLERSRIGGAPPKRVKDARKRAGGAAPRPGPSGESSAALEAGGIEHWSGRGSRRDAVRDRRADAVRARPRPSHRREKLQRALQPGLLGKDAHALGDVWRVAHECRFTVSFFNSLPQARSPSPGGGGSASEASRGGVSFVCFKVHPTPPPSLTSFARRRPSPSRGG